MNLSSNMAQIGGFNYSIKIGTTSEISGSNYNNKGTVDILRVFGYTTVNRGYCEARCEITSSIQIGKEYANTPSFYVELQPDRDDSDRKIVTQTTIKFSNFKYPGRVSGVAINYDKDGKVLAKGEFDFISVKP